MQPITTISQLIDNLPVKAKQIVEDHGRKFSTISENRDALTAFLNALYNDSQLDEASVLGCFGSVPVDTPYFLHLKVFKPTLLTRISKIFLNITRLTIHIQNPNLDFIFRQFPNLTNLELIGPTAPKTLPLNLQKLLLKGSKISNIALDVLLDRYSVLENITLISCYNLTSDAFLSTKSHRNIDSLTLIDCTISQVAFEHLIEKCTLIKELVIEKCPHISCFQPNHIHFEFLHDLTIAHTPIEEKHLRQSVESLPSLEMLCIENCAKISSIFFSSCNFGSTIKIVDLCTTTIDKKGLENLFAKAPGIAALRLSNCPDLTKEDFTKVPFPKTLTEICLENVAIDIEGVWKIQTDLQNLERISYNCPDLPRSLNIKNVSLDEAESRTPSPTSETDTDELQFDLELGS